MEDVRALVVDRDEVARLAAVSWLSRDGFRVQALAHASEARDLLQAHTAPLRLAYLAGEVDHASSNLAALVADVCRHSPGCLVLVAPRAHAAALDPPRSLLARPPFEDVLDGPALTSVVRAVMATLMRQGGLQGGTRVVQVLLLALFGLARGEIQHVLQIAPSTLRDYLDDARHTIELAGIHDVLHRALLLARSDIEGLLREFLVHEDAVVRALDLLQPVPTRPRGRGRVRRGGSVRGPEGR